MGSNGDISLLIEEERSLNGKKHTSTKLNTDLNNINDILDSKGLEFKENPEEHNSNLHTYDKAFCKNTLDRKKWEGINIPGKGRKSDANCGQYMPLKFCSDCGRPHLVKNNCGGHGVRTCPNCWTDWRNYRLKNILIRLISKDLKDSWEDIEGRLSFDEYVKEYRWVHGTVSLKGVGATRDKFREYRTEIHDLVKEWGFDSYIVVPHPFRIDKMALIDEYCERSGKDKEVVLEDISNSDRCKEVLFGSDGYLQEILKDIFPKGWHDLREREDYKEYIKWSPHFHIVGTVGKKREWSRLKEGNKVGGSSWLFKRIRDIESLDHMGKLLSYLLSHAAVDREGKFRSDTPGGDIAYCKFNPEKELSDRHYRIVKENIAKAMGMDSEDLTCPNCDGEDFLAVRHVKKFLLDKPNCEFSELLKEIYEWYSNGGVKDGPPLLYESID